jgi:hypothetical protein
MKAIRVGPSGLFGFGGDSPPDLTAGAISLRPFGRCLPVLPSR